MMTTKRRWPALTFSAVLALLLTAVGCAHPAGATRNVPSIDHEQPIRRGKLRQWLHDRLERGESETIAAGPHFPFYPVPTQDVYAQPQPPPYGFGYPVTGEPDVPLDMMPPLPERDVSPAWETLPPLPPADKPMLDDPPAQGAEGVQRQARRLAPISWVFSRQAGDQTTPRRGQSR